MYKNLINLSEEEKNNLLKRFWEKDPGLWTGNNVSEKDILSRLGWIDIARTIKNTIPEITEFAATVKEQGIKKINLLGMGGSSLAPLMFSKIFKTEDDFPELVILDTTDPEVVENTVSEDEFQHVRFIFASKSGSTVEPNALFSYFWEKISGISREPGSWFMAITDPGTPLAELAEKNRFFKIFLNSPDIGGRYSALSYFGLVPAALIGVDINRLVDNAIKMMEATSASTSWSNNIAGKLIDFLSINLLRSKEG
jgi:glucose-6-phosphate isomerase